jgi:hypothetical protein
VLDPHYVTGLVETAGSFTYSRASRSLTLYFALRLGRRDRNLLTELQQFFGAGRLYSVARGIYYRVSRQDELSRIVDHFDRFPLLGHKKEQYLLWREMVELKSRFRRAPQDQLRALAERLSALGK